VGLLSEPLLPVSPHLLQVSAAAIAPCVPPYLRGLTTIRPSTAAINGINKIRVSTSNLNRFHEEIQISGLQIEFWGQQEPIILGQWIRELGALSLARNETLSDISTGFCPSTSTLQDDRTQVVFALEFVTTSGRRKLFSAPEHCWSGTGYEQTVTYRDNPFEQLVSTAMPRTEYEMYPITDDVTLSPKGDITWTFDGVVDDISVRMRRSCRLSSTCSLAFFAADYPTDYFDPSEESTRIPMQYGQPSVAYGHSVAVPGRQPRWSAPERRGNQKTIGEAIFWQETTKKGATVRLLELELMFRGGVWIGARFGYEKGISRLFGGSPEAPSTVYRFRLAAGEKLAAIVIMCQGQPANVLQFEVGGGS